MDDRSDWGYLDYPLEGKRGVSVQAWRYWALGTPLFCHAFPESAPRRLLEPDAGPIMAHAGSPGGRALFIRALEQ
jgi:hypothetical protein